MASAAPWRLLAAFVAVATLIAPAESQFRWQVRDRYDEIQSRIDLVTMQNCRTRQAEDLFLPMSTVPAIPHITDVDPKYPNRTNLYHVHNTALNRGFFYSFIYNLEPDNAEPGLLYQYKSLTADILGNKWVNASGVFFDVNGTYPNFYRDFFNRTLPLYGPHAIRYDDFNEPTNPGREASLATVEATDMGAGSGTQYNSPYFKINRWFTAWLPDRGTQKSIYHARIKYSNVTGQFLKGEQDDIEFKFDFFGPPGPTDRTDETLGPVVWTPPYFDCGRSDKWIVTATVPIVDLYPRHTEWRHLQTYKYVAVATASVDLREIDINQCPLGLGNEGPNYFANTARCKNTTYCEPLIGYGLRRGGYRCICQPGYRFPHWQNGHYMGDVIERATREEYEHGFNCIKIGEIKVVTSFLNQQPVNPFDEELGAAATTDYPTTEYPTDNPYQGRRRRRDAPVEGAAAAVEGAAAAAAGPRLEKREAREELAEPWTGARVEKREAPEVEEVEGEEVHARRKRASFQPNNRLRQALFQLKNVTKDNCWQLRPEDLRMPSDVIYGVEKFYAMQMYTAVRLANFLSDFLQTINPEEVFSDRLTDKELTENQLIGEVIANVAADDLLVGSGVFYDVNKFRTRDDVTRQFFGPYAMRTDVARTYLVVDFAGHNETYMEDPWFQRVKARWASIHDGLGLTLFTSKVQLRSNTAGRALNPYEHYPDQFFGAMPEDGVWLDPYFDCDGYVNDWVITYSVPFFGQDFLRTGLEFKGVVIVDVKLDMLDIDQCPMSPYVANAFKGTDRCDQQTTQCEFVPGRRFGRGGYKCICKQGYEYPFYDPTTFYDGDVMEVEYEKTVKGLPNRFEQLTCRIGGACAAHASVVATALLLLVATWGR